MALWSVVVAWSKHAHSDHVRQGSPPLGSQPALSRQLPCSKNRVQDERKGAGHVNPFQVLMNIGPIAAYIIIAALVFVEDALFIGFIWPGETAAILGGVLADQQHAHLWLVAMVVVMAAVGGDTVGYLVGRHLGPRILSMRMLARHQPKLDTARSLLDRRGGQAVYLGRFTAFFRAVILVIAVVVLWRVFKHRRHDREASKVSG